MVKKLIAGNWKMNGELAALSEINVIETAHKGASVDIVICPPSLYIQRFSAELKTVKLGAQDCHTGQTGAHTGDISASMIADCGASYVIIGHSERRMDHSETSEQIAQKAHAAYAANLTAIICIGETLEQRQSGSTLNVLSEQLKASTPDQANAANTIIAYEPIWAIGTGEIPTPEQIDEVHNSLRAQLSDRFKDGGDITLLYGGSVKANNAQSIFAIKHVNGALVGGASLKADDFSPIITALEQS